MERREQVSKGEGVLGRVKRGVYQIFDSTIWPQFQVEGSLLFGVSGLWIPLFHCDFPQKTFWLQS